MAELEQVAADILTGLTDRHLVDVALSQNSLSQKSVLVHQKALTPFLDLKAEAKKQGFDLCICSGFRSFERQMLIWNQKLLGERPVIDELGDPINMSLLDPWQQIQAVLRWSALPGTSRHHWGSDFDVYDANAMPEGYQIQLTTDECEGDGVFAPMHEWLSGVFMKGQEGSKGFYRPYAIDRGGIFPEPWHISYAPIANNYAQQLTTDIVKRQLLDNLELVSLDTVLKYLDEIIGRFVNVSVDDNV
ncbi:MAG: M15 family metallopeptidase [Porticoccaceae bacterium]|nr:M15 family metallopeptidase [Porticoccaceae bacterium]